MRSRSSTCLKAAMRQRPDIIIVGEVRGVEAFTLFQAIATGHGGLGTVHADSVEAAINRLTTEPMNVPKSLLGSTLDCLIMQLRIKMKDKSVRRMVHVAEIVGHESSDRPDRAQQRLQVGPDDSTSTSSAVAPGSSTRSQSATGPRPRRSGRTSRTGRSSSRWLSSRT